MVEEPTDDRENAEADEDGASAPVPEKVGEYHLFRARQSFVSFRFLNSDSLSQCFDESFYRIRARRRTHMRESDLKFS